MRVHFSRKPYGWYQNAIFTLAAKLYKRGKIELRQDSNILEGENALHAFLNSSNYGNTLLGPQQDIDQRFVKQLKDLYAEAFDENCPVNEAKDVGLAFRDRLNQLYIEVNQLLARKHEYKFLKNLLPLSELLGRLVNKEYGYFLLHIKEFEDQLLDAKEEFLDPIKRFMNGNQIRIYDGIKALVQGNTANFTYIEGDEFDILKGLMDSDVPYRGDALQKAKAAKDTLSEKVLSAIQAEKDRFNKKYDEVINNITEREEYAKLNGAEKKILQPFENLKKKVEHRDYHFIGNIRNDTRYMEEDLYHLQLNQMVELLTPETNDGQVAEPQPRYIKPSSISIKFDKRDLETEEDVEIYVQALREAYLERIKRNQRIIL